MAVELRRLLDLCFCSDRWGVLPGLRPPNLGVARRFDPWEPGHIGVPHLSGALGTLNVAIVIKMDRRTDFRRQIPRSSGRYADDRSAKVSSPLPFAHLIVPLARAHSFRIARIQLVCGPYASKDLCTVPYLMNAPALVPPLRPPWTVLQRMEVLLAAVILRLYAP